MISETDTSLLGEIEKIYILISVIFNIIVHFFENRGTKAPISLRVDYDIIN